MDAETELFKGVVKFVVDGDRRDIKKALDLADIDWKRFKVLAAAHELAPFCYPALKEFESLAPEEFLQSLRDISQYTSMASELLWKEFLRINNAFRCDDIEIFPIKGMALLKELYRHMPYRRMEDIDLLVREKDFSGADEVMAGLGYERESLGLKEEYWSGQQLHVAYRLKGHKRSAYVELHLICDEKGRNPHILPGFEKNARRAIIDGEEVASLSSEDTLISLTLHKRKWGDVLSLKSVYDLILLLRKHRDNFDWRYCLAQCKKHRVMAPMYFILHQAGFIYKEVAVPSFVWGALRVQALRRKAIRRFIEKNTFLPDNNLIKRRYLTSHFLLYDSLWEPARHIMSIPHEQFAKFYDLRPYSKKARLFHRSRFVYIAYRTVCGFVRSLCYR